ncbi:stage III sporulation protein AA [Bacillus sp. FJAT-49736]|uniref:stage III sporulation protein AA n=1 Tax=Bacillus sp. FJAT-49736 TaxID=2833582 RepID=UPI001BC99E40|nr:stage III sporulation protein AA [Bacillus sp. FJAT-49736]
METIFNLLPKNISEKIQELPTPIINTMEEIRIRVSRPVEVISNNESFFLSYIVIEADAEQFINRIANYSFYTLDEELKKGYITINGGHRVGIAGKVILENGLVKAIRHIASFNIRIAKEKIGVAEPFIPYIHHNKWQHTMIIGPPQTGKTTYLRDIARIISSGVKDKHIPAMKVGIVDERSEIAGCVRGVPQLRFGPRVDILDACPKAEGMMMLIRSMSPDVLIVDEIGREEDSIAILEAINAGITLIMTTHGNSYEDIQKRPILKEILQMHTFERFIELSRSHGPGTVRKIRDGFGNEIKFKAGVSK